MAISFSPAVLAELPPNRPYFIYGLLHWDTDRAWLGDWRSPLWIPVLDAQALSALAAACSEALLAQVRLQGWVIRRQSQTVVEGIYWLEAAGGPRLKLRPVPPEYDVAR